ncbi:hypothetical protein MAR_019056 [Mya arenaria]|uniref:Uncharacterized protein n=1 Tax=Mya arenaria TaxID=6604 RepID=A0ABY7EKD8_MYAAR|nr:hypothetical protein MAR_019056 [Mya arenaria]
MAVQSGQRKVHIRGMAAIQYKRHWIEENVSMKRTKDIETVASLNGLEYTNPTTRPHEETEKALQSTVQHPEQNELSQDLLSNQFCRNLYFSSSAAIIYPTMPNEVTNNLHTIPTSSLNEAPSVANNYHSVIAQATPDDEQVTTYQVQSLGITDDRPKTDQMRRNTSSRMLQEPSHRPESESTGPRARYPSYEDGSVRQRSYASWILRCYECGIGLKDFSDGDDPLREHVRNAPTCRFIVRYFGNQANIDSYNSRNEDPHVIRRRGLTRFLDKKASDSRDPVEYINYV